MAKKGFLYETQISAKDVDALNRFAKATVNVDGGALVALGAIAEGDVFTATKATAGTGGGLYMAYNPSEQLTVVDGKEYAGLSADPRDYTNIANRVFDVFKPQIGDIVGLTAGNIKTGETVEVGKFLEIGADGYEVKASATADTTSFKVIAIEKVPFPQAGIGNEYADKYVCEVAFN